MGKNIRPYGNYIRVKNKKMYVSVLGSDKNVILLLAGLGSACPIIEMKALASYLTDKFTVVTIEFLGYGMSDNASTERTVENIVEDLHEAMKVMGYNKYSIVAHSIAGLYCLHYVQKYHYEITHFIGIDISVPEQIKDFENKIDKMLNLKTKQYESHSPFLAIKTRILSKFFLKFINNFNYSKDDVNVYCEMAVKALHHGSVINELQNAKSNFYKMNNVKFHDDTSVLLLISSRSEQVYPKWRIWHQEILNTSGVMEIIDETHIMHLQNPKLIAEKIDKFICG